MHLGVNTMSSIRVEKVGFAFLAVFAVIFLVSMMHIASATPTQSSLTVSGQAVPSANTIDVGQQLTVTANVASGGTPPYTYALLASTDNEITYNTIVPCSSSGIISCSYYFLTPGNYLFKVQATDNAIPPDNAIDIASNTVIVNPPLLLANPSATPIAVDVGQPIAVTGQAATGGTLPYTYDWGVVNKSTCPGFTDPGNIISFTYTPNDVTTNCVLNEFVTDALQVSTYNKISSAITVNPALAVSISPASNTIYWSQQLPLTTTLSGGIPPFTITYSTSNSLCGSLSAPSNSLAADGSNTIVFAANSLLTSSCSTTFSANVVDSASTPATQSATSEIEVPYQVANVSYKVQNAEDARWGPGYWALDNYTEHVSIWEITPGNYVANVTENKGTWCTFKGALSPNWGTPEPNANCGQYNGTYTANLNNAGSYFNTSATTNGVLNNGNSFDYGGTESAVLTGNSIGFNGPGVFHWVSYYFPGYTGFNYINTGGSSLSSPTMWKYTSSNSPSYSNTLVEALLSNGTWTATGDIITAPLVNVSMPVTNLPDSSPNGYWALDNLTSNMTIFQTGPKSFVANFAYNGIANTFAGLRSPGAFNAIESYNGIVPFTGNAVMAFNGTLLSTPAANTIGPLSAFDDNGVFTGNSINTVDSLSVPDQYLMPIEKYFDANSLSFDGYTGTSNWFYGLGPWSFTYTYNSPVKNQAWTEGASSGVTNTIYSGDILTGFQLTTYDNDFLWTPANTYYAPAAPFGNWSASPEGCYNHNQPVPGTGICASSSGTYANLYPSQDFAPFAFKGNAIITSIVYYNNDQAGNNIITFEPNGSSGRWTMLPNKLSLTENGMPVSEYWRGNLTFSGTPSMANFTGGMLVQWDYINASASNTMVTQYFPDAVYDQSMNAWLIGFNIYMIENKAMPSNSFNIQFPSNNGQLSGTAEPLPYSAPVELSLNGAPVVLMTSPSVHTFVLSTYDNDFLWTPANTYYAPAAPFGTWSATPSGCYASVPGTGICASNLGTNGYANLGGSQDFAPFVFKGSAITTSFAYYNNEQASNNIITFEPSGPGTWAMLPNNLTLTENGMPVSEYWRGNLTFSGTPSMANFTGGILAQWDYIKTNSIITNSIVKQYLPDAVYDQSMGAWLVGFNVYLLENKCYPSSCAIPSSYFNMPFPADYGQLSGTAEPLPYLAPVELSLNSTPTVLMTSPSARAFILNSYDNDFFWFGFNEFNSNTTYGAWSNCPDLQAGSPPANNPMSNVQCLGITATGGNGFDNSSWDLNAQSFGTGSDFTPFVMTSADTMFTQITASPYQPMKMSGYIHFTRVGNTDTWTASASAPNNVELTWPTTNDTSAPFGYLLEGGNLTFSGTPSTANFINGTIYEWSYNYKGMTANTVGLGKFTDAVVAPNQANMPLLALTGIYYMSAQPRSASAVANIIAGAPYLGTSPGMPANLNGYTANIPMTLAPNSITHINYTQSGAVLTIKSASGNTVAINVLLSNLTSSTGSMPTANGTSFSKLLVLDINASSYNGITYGLTVAYPCGSNTAPYKLNTTTGAWVAIPFSRNAAACTMTFVIPPDPTIGLFTSTPLPSSIGSGTASGSGTAGGSTGPTVVPFTASNATGYYVYNITTDNSENLVFNGTTIRFLQNFITPNTTGITVDGNSYTLKSGETIRISNDTFVVLDSIEYVPILHTANYTVYKTKAAQPAANTTTSTATTTVPTTTIAPPITVVPTPPKASAAWYTKPLYLLLMAIAILAIIAAALYMSRASMKRVRKR